jgi:Methyltransferase domain
VNIITPDIYNGLELLPKVIAGWNSDSPAFRQLITQYSPKHIIEVGTWLGGSAFTMARAIRDLNLSCKITCVDTWLGALEFWDQDAWTIERNLQQKNGYPQVYYQFLSNVVHEGFQDIILPFPTTSLIAARFFARRKITADLIYIDGSHDYEDIIADLKAYWPLTTTAMFGDDYAWSSVKTAVDEFSKVNNLQIHMESGMWVIKK